MLSSDPEWKAAGRNTSIVPFIYRTVRLIIVRTISSNDCYDVKTVTKMLQFLLIWYFSKICFVLVALLFSN